MFETKDTLINNLRSPMNVAAMALDEIQNRLEGTKVIADPNSPFCHLLEFGSSINAATITTVDEKLPIIYAPRAKTMSDLFHHMSDFDYLRMYSTPSQTQMRLTLPKKYLIEYALDYNENYKQVTLPKDTVFMVGKYPFGMYYPINILINNFTQTFTVVYDTAVTNPLMALTKNIVDKYDVSMRGLDYLTMDFPIYQFAKSVQEESLVAETGFAKKIIYNNKFYALRLFSYKDRVYTELGQSQSKVVYDTSRPTALIRVLPDEQKIQITIPQIYFDQDMLGSKLYIEVYTTLGALDIDTTNISGSAIQANFAQKSKDTTVFSSVFKNLPFDLIMQLSSNKISGGSNAISVDTLRDRVVNDTLYEKAPISEEEMAVYLEDNGFYLKKYRDNVTDRIYHAYRVLEDGKGAIIPSVTLKMRMLTNYTQDRVSFRLQSDESITVLPTTIYQYIEEADDAIPLTDDELEEFSKMDKQTLADTLNSGQYFKTPFHLRINLDDYYPQTVSYNLMTPEIKNVMFEAENFNVSAKMMTFTARVLHLNEGVGGYQVDLSVYKSDDLRGLSEDLIKVYILARSSDGYWIGRECVFSENVGERDIYTFNIETNYHLTMDGEIGITNFTSESVQLSEHMVSLESNFYVVFMVDRTAIQGTFQDASQKITQGVPSSYLSQFVALSRQYVTIHLGHSLIDVINNNTEAAATPKTYVTWDHDVPALYGEDEYARDSSGQFITIDNDDGTLSLVKEHSVGEQKVDTNGQLVWLHKIGDVRRNAAGEPMVEVNRNKIYYIDLMFIDAKVFASERTAEMTFASSIHETLEGYFAIIRNLQEQLLERTLVYFRCVRSTGTAKFNLGDGVVSKQNIEMSFRITCYVPSYVKQSEEIQATIQEKTCQAIESAIKTKTISMLDIFEIVKEKMSDYIDHFTLLGINGMTGNQTFAILSEDAQPSVARKLELTEDNILSLNKQVIMDFVALEDHTSTVSYEV